MFRLARSSPPAPGGPNRKLRTLSTTFVSTSDDGSDDRYFSTESMPLADESGGLKNAWLRDTSGATGLPLLYRNWTSLPSRLWPTRNAAVENSLAMPGFTAGL